MVLCLDKFTAVFDSTCTACPLHSQCKTVCIPASWYGRDRTEWPSSVLDCEHSRALYVIGEAPGWNEDKQGQGWVGTAGRILKTLYLDYFKFADEVDIFLSNAVRCHPPGNKTPSKTQLKQCQGFYLADIINLQKLYDQVIVLCCGGPATHSVLGTSLKKSFCRQGDTSDFRALTAPTPKSIVRVGEIVGPYLDDPTLPPFPRPCPVFTTYHPAAVGRDKNKGIFVQSHLKRLQDFLAGDLTYEITGGSLAIQTAPTPPGHDLPWLSLDIETYGILKGRNQTQFHPLKSVLYDGIPPEDLVVTTGITWPNAEGEMEHGIFLMSKEAHRRKLWAWIRKLHTSAVVQTDAGESGSHPGPGQELSASGGPKPFPTSSGYLIGQNVKFDLMYLRFAYPECKTWLNYPLPVVDLIVTNYLLNEGRPERSLKALAPLLGVTKYGEGFTQHPSATCTSLHQYNCQDTAATILLQKKLESLISQLYGPNSPKLSDFNCRWYSRLLWLLVWMEESGIAMNKPALNSLLESYEARATKLERGIKERWDIVLRGKGSEKHKREIMDRAVGACLDNNLQVPKLSKTTVKREISFNEENRNCLLDVLPVNNTATHQLRAVGTVQAVAGILDRYLYPLLVGRGKGHTDPTTRLIDGLVYPRWYPVPSDYEDGASGGTKQCRIVAKGPPCQTFPPRIKACITSRYSHIMWFDYSQIELRMAALLSNDPWMMEEYSKPNCDFHLGTSTKLFGEADAKKFRQMGKVLNFLVIYLGGAAQYQTSLMQDVGIFRSKSQCQKDIDEWWKQAAGLAKWQADLLEFVCTHGYFELPLAGQSRLFLGNLSDVKDQMKEIVNMPVQAVAANVMLSAQFELQWSFMQKGMKAILPLNVYDAASIEFPKSEEYAVRQEMARILPNPPYYQALCAHLGRSLPLEYDVKIKQVSP